MPKRTKSGPKPKKRAWRKEGALNNVFDQRVSATPIEPSWENKVIIDDNGDVLVRYEDVEQIMIENEQLRETLYAQMNDIPVRHYFRFTQLSGHSTSNIIKKIKELEKFTGIPAPDLYQIVYNILITDFLFSFKDKRPKESKLQYVWRMGALPTVSLQVKLLEQILMKLYRDAPQEFYKLIDALKTKRKPKKPNKSTRKSPF